jgi:hypothetical protein
VHNKKVGGTSNSSHKTPTCKAESIKAQTTFIRNHLVSVARDVSFKRIGVGRTFVHLDADDMNICIVFLVIIKIYKKHCPCFNF